VDVAGQWRQAAEHQHHGQRLLVVVLDGDERREQRSEWELALGVPVIDAVSLIKQQRHPAALRLGDLADSIARLCAGVCGWRVWLVVVG
jgi:hypothetical protein